MARRNRHSGSRAVRGHDDARSLFLVRDGSLRSNVVQAHFDALDNGLSVNIHLLSPLFFAKIIALKTAC